MRTFLMLCLVALITGCSQSPQQKAEKLVSNYLKEVLHDPDSYEPSYFTNLDTTWYHYTNEVQKIEQRKDDLLEKYSQIITIRNLYHYLKIGREDFFEASTYNMDINKVKKIRAMTNKDIEPYIKTVDSLALITDKMDREIDSLKQLPPQQTGFKLLHKYRAKNKMGAKVLEEATFYISPDLNIVVHKK